jgi:hypothetical protein
VNAVAVQEIGEGQARFGHVHDESVAVVADLFQDRVGFHGSTLHGVG